MSVVHVRKATDPGSISQLLESLNPQIDSDHVFIKPNIVVPAKPSSGIVTDPAFVRGVIEYLGRKGVARITVGESPSVSVDVEEAFRVSGYGKMAREAGVALVNLNNEETTEIRWGLGTVRIPKLLVGAYYINAAKLKTHINTTVSLGLKNQKGLIRDGSKKLMHMKGLHMPIVELAKVVRPNLTLIDGVIGLEGDGPSFWGRRVKSNVIIGSEDMVAGDGVACRAMGIDPYEVQHIRLAAQAGLGSIDPEVAGDKIAEVAHAFRRANEQCRRTLRLTRWQNPYTCSGCGSGLAQAVLMMAGDLRLAMRCGPRFAYGILFGGVDIITGSNAALPARHGKVICMGRCTKSFAAGNGFIWVDGCPPQAKDIVEGFRRL